MTSQTCITEVPGLDELLADPMVRALMVRDGITPEGTRRLVHDMRRRLYGSKAITNRAPLPPDHPAQSWTALPADSAVAAHQAG